MHCSQASRTDLHALPEELDEILVTLHIPTEPIPALGDDIAAFAQEHGVHVCVKVEGPFKSGHHRILAVSFSRRYYRWQRGIDSRIYLVLTLRIADVDLQGHTQTLLGSMRM